MPPSIVLLTQVFPPAVGGSGVLLDNVYRRLTDIDVTVVVDRETCRVDSSVDRANLRLVPARIDPAQWGLFDPRGWRGHVKLARLLRRLAHERPAIVHCGRAQPEGIAAMAARLLPGGPKFVFWAHGEEITTANSSGQFKSARRGVYRRAAGAIANCHHTARMVANEGVNPEKIAVVYPGVDSARFRPIPGGGPLRQKLAPGGELLLLTVGRLQTRKGHDLVLRALGQINQAGPSVRYIIVGNGVERERLEQMTRDLGLGGVVHFAGEVPEADLSSYFAACDVFVMPNRVDGPDFEGFGIVFLEAAAAGLPTIGGRNGGVPEAIGDGETGMLVSGTDIDELAETIDQYRRSPELRNRFGAAGRERVLHDFTWEAASLRLRTFHELIASEP